MTGRVVLAAGGTGGHVFPALAVADELLRRGYRVSLATDSRGAGFGDRAPGIDVHRVAASNVRGGAISRIGGALAVGAGAVQAWLLLARLRPAGVVGFGGYPSVPTTMAAAARRIPIVIHEQNAVLGRANRLVAGRAAAIAASFERTRGIRDADRPRTFVTGNPVRAAFGEARARAYPPANGRIGLLVLGGSQGAAVFADVVPQAFAALSTTLRRRFAVTQQCRPEDLGRTRRAYLEIGVQAELATFFDDVPDRMADAHAVVARAGASTVAELAEAGRPAILAPYPHAADDHQTANARAVADGAAWLLSASDFTAAAVAARLREFANDPSVLARAAAAMRERGGRDAAGALVDRLEQLVGREAAA